MCALQTTTTYTVRSYEIGPSRQIRSSQFLRWFQEAAYTNSTVLGFGLDQYRAMGVAWVLREVDLDLLRLPYGEEEIAVTTWIADMRRSMVWRQYVAHDQAGEAVARCNATWVMIDFEQQRPARIPQAMFDVFVPGEQVLAPLDWPAVEADFHGIDHSVSFFEEDELAHVNHANYLDWIEESARCAALAANVEHPRFARHRLRYQRAAVRGDQLRIGSAFTTIDAAQHWQHRVIRGDATLVTANSKVSAS